MKKTMIAMAVVAALTMMACGGKKHDAAYYEAMVDSIRKAETVKTLERKAGIYDNDVDAWFDTLAIHTLPIHSARSELWKIGHFEQVPMRINEYFGYAVSAKLQAMALPTKMRRQVVMVAEMVDSVTPRLYLYTMDRRHQPIDQLCLYDSKKEDREDDFGESFMDYFITSNYEITIMLYYQSHDDTKKPELLNTRRYIIDKEGRFEEVIIELE